MAKRLLALLTMVAIIITMCSMVGMVPTVSAQDSFTITNLKVNGEDYPVIDDTAHFSWQMKSDVIGKSQSAYQIILKNGTQVVWNSSKQSSDKSVGISYSGPALTPSTVYNWTVTVWDEDDASVISPTAEFETGLGSNASAWNGSSWIAENPSGVPTSVESADYVVEADLTINGTTAVGVVFNQIDPKVFLMWQVNSNSQISGAVVLRPHRYVNGSWTTLANINVSNLVSGLTVETLKTTPLHLKIAVTTNTINTYVNDVLVDANRAFPTSGSLSKAFAGNIGAHSGGNEGGNIDNLKLTDYKNNISGEVLYNYDFSGPTNPLTYNSLNSNVIASLDNGTLKMFGSGTALVQPEALHYTVEADVAVSQKAVGVIFNYYDSRNMLMWQVAIDGARVRLRPHQRVNGTWRDINSVDINLPGVTPDTIKSTMVHMKIDVTATTITTYMNGIQVATQAAGSFGLKPKVSIIGGHSGANEGGYLDNLKMTDYTTNTSGDIIYDYDFNDGVNPLTGDPHSNLDPVSVDGGKLHQFDNRWSLPSSVRKSPFPSFRKKINVSGEVEWARLYSTALGAFDMYIDGARVGEKTAYGVVYDELKPGYTSASKRIQYYTYDVTDALASGEHLLSAQLAKGWYGGLSGGVSSTLQLRAKLVVKYKEQAEPVVIGTDSSWKTSYASGVMFSAIYDGETYDGNTDESWRSDISYNDTDWIPAAVMTSFSGRIDPISGSRVRVREDLTRDEYTVTVYNGATGANNDQYGKINVVGTYTQDDTFTLYKGETAVIDFGQNFAGWPEITARGAKNTAITMRCGEMLNDMNGIKTRGNDGPEGSVYHANYRSAASISRYIMNGNSSETNHSNYTFYGFRYIDITASADITVESLRGLVLTSMHEDVGTIETSSAGVNKLISNIKWGGYSNILSIPTDCPQRNERAGWTADTQVFATTGMYYSDLQNFYIKWMEDMRDAARASDGAFRTIAPINETEGYEAGWSDAGVIVPYNVYKMTGDKRILEQNWDAMQKFMDVYMASTNKNGGGTRYGDWVSLENNEEDVKRLCAIAYFAGDALLMAEMAKALGKTADVTKYIAVYESEKEYFIQKYVNPDGSLKRGEQTSCLMALAYDLLPNDASKEKVKNALLTNLSNNGNKLQTGFLGTAIIMQTLTKIGASDMAYNLLLQDQFPSWLYCVDLGATTTWERWNSYTIENGFNYQRMNSNDPANMNSFNHYAYGVVGEWMYGYMAGIMYDIANPGFKHTILQPTVDTSERMTNVIASYDSAYGKIESAWKLSGNTLKFDCKVPANTTATVHLPVTEGKTVTVNGKDAQALTIETNGIEYVKTENGKAIFNTKSGGFSFLVSGGANYSSVEAAIAAVPADLTIYSSATVLELEAAINAVDYMLGTDEQRQVDAYAVAILLAIERLIPIELDLQIGISAFVDTSAQAGRKDIVWKANILLNGGTNYADFNDVKIKSYGVFYGTSTDAVANWKVFDAQNPGNLRQNIFDAGDDINVYTSYGFRLKSVPVANVRAAMFYIEYEYNGHIHYALSEIDSITAE